MNFSGDLRWATICRDGPGGGGGGSGGGYSGRGGDDSPSEGGRGPGVGLGGQSTASSDSSGRSSSSSSSGGRGGNSAAPDSSRFGGGETSGSGGRSSGNSGGRSAEAASGRYSGPAPSVASVGAVDTPGTGTGSFYSAEPSSGRFGGPAPSVASVGGVDTPGTGTGGFFSSAGLDGGMVSSVSNGDYSGRGGQDSPSESAGGPGGGRSGGYSGAGGADSPSESGPGPGGRVGGYSGRGGGYDTPSETSGVGRGSGFGAFGGAGTGRDMSLASSARAAENQSMYALYAYEKTPVSVVSYGPGFTTVALRDGTIETRSGDRASRNNNPGNIEATGRFAPGKSAGAIGTDGRFAVFASREQGLKAMEGLVFGPSYAGRTIGTAISKYAPAFENDTAKYAATVASKVGVPVDTKLSDLSPAQRSAMVTAMVGVEGNTGYTSKTVTEGKSYGYAPQGNTTSATPAASTAQDALPDTAPTPTSRPEYSALPAEAPTPTSRISQFYDTPDEGRFAARYLSQTQPSVEASTTAAHQQFAATIGTTNVLGIDGRTAPYGSITGVNTVAPGQTAVQSGTNNEAARSAAAAADVSGRAGRVGVALSPSYSGMGGQDSPREAGPGPGMGAGVVAEDDTSLGEDIGAAVIDVGLGMIPGVGTVATIGNIGLTLAGRNTIGQTIMDVLTSGNSRGILSAAGVDTGDGGWSLDLSTDTEELVDEGRPPEVTDFGTRYLGWRDDTRRPTPREKWSTDRGSYGRREYS